MTLTFHQAARLPLPGDNCAIAIRALENGTQLQGENGELLTVSGTVMVGHRFAVERIPQGKPLLSWGLPFGFAVRDIQAGEYVFNEGMATEMAYRDLDYSISEANFRNDISSFRLDEENFLAGKALEPAHEKAFFEGFERPDGRGVGTRNFVIILATNSTTASFARLLDGRLKSELKRFPNVDGIVAVSHTEGGSELTPNNREIVLRTLAGFVIHPNVAAALIVDSRHGTVTNDALESYLDQHGYPRSGLRLHYHTVQSDLGLELDRCARLLTSWLPEVNASKRSRHPASELKIALQCGGSDAFSGVSANPLASWVAREIIRHGGAANLAETDELIGAEPYVLSNVRSLEVAQDFLGKIERYKEMTSWHGVTAEGNPSGGNKLRGLYNIALKSIGAAMKRHPEVRLEGVLEYSARIPGQGFYFMDSPGNDLESVAGQVASGANIIFFTTGNGSITNFPFVPTVKLITTTPRYELLSQEMDVNAGEYLDGVSMEELGRRTFDLTLAVASGQKTKGEQAGHYQVCIWRDWRQQDGTALRVLQSRPEPDGRPLPLARVSGGPMQFKALKTPRGYAADQVGLIMPTSQCSAQVSQMIADQLSSELRDGALSRFVALPHTEGCGYLTGEAKDIFVETLVSYLTHPLVGAALLLEHGCDKIHNGVVKARLIDAGIDPGRFGMASIQLDGGLERVTRKVVDWFASKNRELDSPGSELVDWKGLITGVLSARPLSEQAGAALCDVIGQLVACGASVISPDNDPVLSAILSKGLLACSPSPTLSYGMPPSRPGFHVMENPGRDWLESLTGLAAGGCSLILAYQGSQADAGHPLVPVLRVSAELTVGRAYAQDLDLVLEGPSEHWTAQLLDLLQKAASRQYAARSIQLGHTNVQFTRGLLGFSA